MLTVRRQWMQEEEDFDTPNNLNGILFFCMGVFVRICDT